MKKIAVMNSKGFILGLIVLVFLFSFSNCNKKNQSPACVITYPNNGDEFEQGNTITISVEAKDNDGLIDVVNFYIDDIEIFSSSSFPYEYNWYTLDETRGNHIIKATAIDNDHDLQTDECAISIIGKGKVQIGNQVWMTKNLKTTHYADGTPIQLVEDKLAWDALDRTIKAYCYYNNNSSNGDTYGLLYTWAAAMNRTNSSNTNPSDVQGVCPDGWHVPSDAEWKELEMYLGMSQIEADEIHYRGIDEGGKLKQVGTIHWNGPNEGATNESGFSALPGGCRSDYGLFRDLGSYGHWWCSTEDRADYAWSRELGYNDSGVDRNNKKKKSGFSVRCIKDD